jgi:CubicO group peptidase (beta-lactamase class C family)
MKALHLVAVVLSSASFARAAEPLPRSSPEAQGISSTAISAFVLAANKNVEQMHSFVLLRHGNLVASGWWTPYHADAPCELYSLGKSFTSTAVGMAVAEGKLSVDEPVLKFFPDDAPAEPSKNLKDMRIKDLLRMCTGHADEPELAEHTPWTKAFLAQPVPHKPGTHFLYNTSATFMLSAIVQKATAMALPDYLRPRLFEPLGIDRPTWYAFPQGISFGAYGLSLRTEDIARFGQLLLQKGRWNGNEVLPAEWVEAATARQTATGSDPKSDWEQGYGYQFWRCRHGAFRGDGAFGQYCIVMPEQDAVIAITSAVKDPGILNLVWDKLLPQMKPAPLAADPESCKELELMLSGLTLRPQEGSGTPSKAINAAKTFVFRPNSRELQSIRLVPDDKRDAVTLVASFAGKENRISCPNGRWQMGRFADGPGPAQPAAASGGWTGDSEFTAKICFYETPFVVTLHFKFSGDRLLLDRSSNVSFSPGKPPQLVGKAVEN